MAAGTERSKALHNFTMPGGLRWRNQRHLRCVRVESDYQVEPLNRFTDNGSDFLDHDQGLPIEQRGGERGFLGPKLVLGGSNVEMMELDGGCGSGDCEGDGVSAAEEVAVDIQTTAAATESKEPIFGEIRGEGAVSLSVPTPVEGETCRPWNLRNRRAESNVSGSGGDKRLKVDKFSGRVEAAIERPSRLRKGGNSATFREEKRPKFSISLSKREIEEDFFSMTSRKLPRRPKKRPKNVQKEVDLFHPGFYLSEVTTDMY